ncbi:MAG: magnesium transporter MgtE N-terminal domain-containing protein, partial [Candidatus Xenobia bacterium]
MIVTEVGVTTFVSKLMGAPVMDEQDVLVGRLEDFVLQAEETGVKVTQIVVRRGRQQYLMPVEQIASVAPRLFLRGAASLSVITDPEADQLRLVRDVLDAQVIDPDGAKVIRVNDVQLDWVENHLVVSGLDIGLWGISRRLGLATALATAARIFKLHIPEGVVPWKDVAPIAKGFHHLNLSVPREQVERMHPADLARIVAELGHSARQELLNHMTVEQMADVVEEAESEVAVAILDDLDDEKAADVLDAMEPDEAADVLADVPEEDREKLMDLMEPEGAQEVRELMQHPEGTAGAVMNTNFWTLPADI